MDAQVLTYIFVGLSFSLYIGIAYGADQLRLRNSTLQAATCIQWQTVRRRLLTGCLQLLFYRWQASSHLRVQTVLGT